MEELKINDEIYSEEYAQKYIEEIYNKYINSDRDFALDSLAGAEQSLEMAFPGSGHFLMEFIQNSDDAKSNSLEIELTERSVKISNDGVPFSKADVKSLCKVGRSSKSHTDSIGYLGVGFKSVFLISDATHIYSGYYRFKFEKDFWGKNSKNTPWQIIPIWIADQSYNKDKKWNTEFILNFPDKIEEEQVHALESEISSDNLNNRVSLFLNNLKCITIHNKIKGKIRKIMKSTKLKTEDYEIHSIKDYENDKLINEDFWLVFRRKVKVPEELLNDPTTPRNRKNISEREVLVSFKLDQKNNLTTEKSGTAHMGVFSFLPLKEVKSGLSFLVQSDFITTTGRTDINRESAWNEWIIGEIYKLIIEKCVPAFLHDQNWRLNFTTILLASGISNTLFKQHLVDPLEKYLQESSVLIDSNGEEFKSRDLIELNTEMHELLSEEDKKLLFPKLKIMHSKCIPHENLDIAKGPASLSKFFDLDKTQELLNSKAKDGNIDWFIKLYSMLAKKYNMRFFKENYRSSDMHFDMFWDNVVNCSIKMILTDNFELARVSECYTNYSEVAIPDNLKEHFKIVHPEIAESKGFKLFLEKLNEERYCPSTQEQENLRELTEEEVMNKYYFVKILEIDGDKWESMSECERFKEVKNIKDCYCHYKRNSIIFNSNLSYLTIPSKSGKWLKPDELIFGKEYRSNAYNLEILIENKIYDLDDIDFVSSEFVSGIKEGTNEMNEWVTFFEYIGVDKILKPGEGTKLSKIVGRIGMVTAEIYEKKNNRNPKSLNETEPLGYDIISEFNIKPESESESSEKDYRYIEVKATKDSDSKDSPSVNNNQAKALAKLKDKFNLYHVTDALTKPKLRVVNGKHLSKIIVEGSPTSFRNQDFSKYVEDVFDPLEYIATEKKELKKIKKN